MSDNQVIPEAAVEAAARAGDSARATVSTGDLAGAISTIEFSRNTHVEWAAYMRGHNDCKCDCGKPHPDVKNLGDTAYHENCIAEYDNVLAVLRGTSATALEASRKVTA